MTNLFFFLAAGQQPQPNNQLVVHFESSLLKTNTYTKTTLKFIPSKRGTGFYGFAKEPWVDKNHQPINGIYNGTLEVFKDVRILKITENIQNGSNSVWINNQNSDCIYFLIIRDIRLFQKFLQDFNKINSMAKCTIEYDGTNVTVT